MLPPPAPPVRPNTSVMGDFSELESLIQQAYVSPDMTMADSAVFVGFGGSASGAQSSSNAAAGTPIGGTTLSPGGVGSVDPDFDNLLSAWMSPSTQNLPTPLSTFSTSPALYSSPFSDHLSTPAVDPISLDSRNLPTSPGSSTGPASRRDSKAPQPNGVRKNVQVRDLIPLDAPIQSRNYITPSSTSRKDIPPSVARTFVPNSRKRSSQMAGLPSTEDMQDELAAEDDPAVLEEMQRRREMDPEKVALLEHVEQARRRNTLAARKSRQRKLEHVRNLEELVETLQADNEELKKGMDQKDMEIAQLKEKLRIAEEKLQASLGGVPSSSS
ncbi:hypothetical protein FRC01_002535 [Tulasnella sp. 417]|nr:hypothetical protein FRC01_002535 [Tulasnella sp. 417]